MKREPFLTGTRAYGPAREDSDWDIGMMEDDAQQMKKAIELFGVHTELINSHYKNGFVFMAGSKTVMIIGFTCEDKYNSWKYATDEMVKILPIKIRSDRIKMFVRFQLEWVRKNRTINSKKWR